MADDKNKGFAVLTNIPMPSQKRGRKKGNVADVYPFATMQIGQSFIVAGKANIQKARNAAQQWVRDHLNPDGKTSEWKFQTRDVSGYPNGMGGFFEKDTYGMWRVLPTADAPQPAVQVTAEGQVTTSGEGEQENPDTTVEIPVPVLSVNPE